MSIHFPEVMLVTKGKLSEVFLEHSKSDVVKMPAQLPVIPQAEGTASDG